MNASFVKDLKEGKTVKFRPKGNSMKGKVESGSLVTVEPNQEIKKDDIVFCKVNGNFYVHLVSAVKICPHRGNRYQISNNRGHVNGWVTENSIYGKVVKIEL